MEYIAHRAFCRNTLGGEVKIKRGDTLTENDGFLFFDGKPVCTAHSQAAKEHFAINFDDNGLRRGDLTYAIAFAQPLSELQKDVIVADSGMAKFLLPCDGVILFNDDFFRASLIELWNIAGKLGIKE